MRAERYHWKNYGRAIWDDMIGPYCDRCTGADGRESQQASGDAADDLQFVHSRIDDTSKKQGFLASRAQAVKDLEKDVAGEIES